MTLVDKRFQKRPPGGVLRSTLERLRTKRNGTPVPNVLILTKLDRSASEIVVQETEIS